MHINECTIPPICIFHGFEEFFTKRNVIRNEVDLMDLNTLVVYKMYIYSTPFVTDYIRNGMWDFLMRDEDDLIFIQIYADYKKKNKTTL